MLAGLEKTKAPIWGLFFVMTGFILGTKGEMTQRFNDGIRMPTTKIITAPCFLVDVISLPTGINKAVLATKIAKQINKPNGGKLIKAGIKTPLRFFREVPIDSSFEIVEKEGKKGIKIGELELFVGQEIKPPIFFKKDDTVQVTGISKGKGFAGVVKRHRFAGGPRTHGQSDRERAPGSIGAGTTPGRVLKGKRMAGRMGSQTVTVKGLKVIEATDESLEIKGLVPGAIKTLLIIRSES